MKARRDSSVGCSLSRIWSLLIRPGATQFACAAPAYLAARGTPATPADLAGHACLGFVNAAGLPYAEWRFTKGDGDHAVRIPSRFQVNDGRVLAAAAVAGHGIVLQAIKRLVDRVGG